MALNDTLASVLSQVDNSIKVGKFVVTTKYSSKLILEVLTLMKEAGYINSFEEIQDERGNYCLININTSLNKCGVIKPRFSIKLEDFEKFEKRFLLAKGFGYLIISTNKGLMTHVKAKEEGLGGRLISYCY
jgi:small subunit ribosomal protein S8